MTTKRHVLNIHPCLANTFSVAEISIPSIYMKMIIAVTLCSATLVSGCGGGSNDQSSPFSIISNDASTSMQNTTAETGEPAIDTQPTALDQSTNDNTSQGDDSTTIDASGNTDISSGSGSGSTTSTETNNANQTTESQTTPPAEPLPVLADQQVPAGFADGVEGLWYCASAQTDDAGQYRAEWNTPWQLNFKNDQTVVLLDGSNAVSSWWYTADGMNIQWSHNGVTTTYLPNVNNRGGMADDGSHCLRELPPTEPNGLIQQDPVSHTISTPDGQTVQTTPYSVTREDFLDTFWSCALVYYYETPFEDGRWTTGPNSTQTWSFNADGSGYHYVYRSNGDWNFSWQWTANGAEITRNSDGVTYLFQINNSSDSSYWVYNYPINGDEEIRPVQQSGEYSGGYGCSRN